MVTVDGPGFSAFESVAYDASVLSLSVAEGSSGVSTFILEWNWMLKLVHSLW